jgi:SAM-dependent methyltransferase
MAVSDTARSEIDFVADYWTKVWREQGDPAKRLARVRKRPEFRVMAPYLAALPKDARILDGGCGLGEWTVALGRMGYRTLGIDVSGETIEKLLELFSDNAFAVADIRDTKLEAESFDAYFSWGVFEHFEEGLQRCIAEAFRVLRPGGVLFVTVPFDNLRHALSDGLTRGRAMKPAPGLRFYQWRLNRAELSRELAVGGFEVLEVRPVHKRQGVLRWLSRTFGLRYDRFYAKAASAVLAPFVPGAVIAHMLMAVARKPWP